MFASNPLFRHVTPAEERLLLDAFEPIAFASGTVIITQGERHGDKFYVVEDGTCTYAVDGRVVGACGRGGAFGERALLQDAPRAATVTAATAVLAWALDKPHFEAVLARSVPKPPPTATSSASLWQRGGSAVRAAVRLRRFASNESDAQKRWRRARARVLAAVAFARCLQHVRDHARSLPWASRDADHPMLAWRHLARVITVAELAVAGALLAAVGLALGAAADALVGWGGTVALATSLLLALLHLVMPHLLAPVKRTSAALALHVVVHPLRTRRAAVALRRGGGPDGGAHMARLPYLPRRFFAAAAGGGAGGARGEAAVAARRSLRAPLSGRRGGGAVARAAAPSLPAARAPRRRLPQRRASARRRARRVARRRPQCAL